MVKKIVIVVLVLLNLGCDQISKDLIRKNVDSSDYIQLIGDHLIMTNVENTGAMLGFGDNFSPILKNIILKGLPIIVLFVILFRIWQKKKMNLWLIIAFGFVIGGGVGNLIDRIAYGSVTDFFQIKLGLLRTGIFNMADVSITLGTLLILALFLRNRKLEF